MRWRIEAWGGPVSGVASADQSWARRDGWLLSLLDGERCLGRGEATPLPGFGRDTLEAARAELERLPTPERMDSLEAIEAFASSCSSPSARFALESALLDALGASRGQPLSTLLAGGTPAPVARCVLIGRLDDDGMLARAADAVRHGARRLKAKTSARDIDRDVARLRELTRLGASVRLDLNGSLDPTRARAALAAYAAAGVSLVEEPTHELLSLGACALPWLADESMLDHADVLLEAPDCAGIVLKPTLLGGLLRCRALARRARARDRRVVVTHAFEGPVALAGVAALALALGAEAGVDRHAGLAAFPPASFSEIPLDGDTLVPATRPGLGVSFTERAWTP